MNAPKVLREIMEVTGTSQRKLATLAGIKHQSQVSHIVRSENMTVTMFDRLLNSMGYQLKVIELEDD